MSNNIRIIEDTETNIKQNQEYISLKDYMIKNKKARGDKEHTHVWWGEHDGGNIIFNVPDEDYDKFISLYRKECITNFGKLHVLEKPKEVGPLCLDFDFKQIDLERNITSDMIIQIVGIITRVIKTHFITEEKNLISIVLMKDEPVRRINDGLNGKTVEYSDGLHIQYPYLYLQVENRYFIYEEVKREIARQNIFSEIYPKLSDIYKRKKEEISSDSNNDADDVDDVDDEEDKKYDNIFNTLSEKDKEAIINKICDDTVINKNKWFMYGSGKVIEGEDINLYLVKYIFDYNLDEINEIPSINKLVKILAIRHPTMQAIPIKNSEYIRKRINEIKNKYISKKLDLFVKNEESNANQNPNQNANQNSIQNIASTKQDNSDNAILARKYVKLLSAKRAINYQDWIVVCWTLKSISNTLLPEFLEFSKLCKDKYDEQACIKFWNDANGSEKGLRGYTIASLIRWAKEDNYEGYMKIMREKICKFLDSGLLNTDYDVAKIVHEMYKNDFVCVSIAGKEWYQFNGTRWCKVEDGYTLSEKLSTEVCEEFAKLDSYNFQQAAGKTGRDFDECRKKSDELRNLIFRLKKNSAKKAILSECSGIFMKGKENFKEQLDQNNYLIGFNNGIYDLANARFREGLSEDLVSRTTGYDYKEFTMKDPIIIQIMRFMESIQPNENIKTFLLRYIASFLQGGNKDQRFTIWTGSGGNGKGTLIELINNTLGEMYAGTLPATFLTRKSGASSAASPDLADTWGKRLVVMQEPDSDDKIQVGLMKNITGQDKVMARELYCKPFYFVPQFKLILACNQLPAVSANDDGVWRRVLVIDFPIKFVKNPQAENERKGDDDIREKLASWHQGFMWLLLTKYYPLYGKDGLGEIPEEVKVSTDKYKEDSNFFLEFFNELLIDDKGKSIDLKYTYENFCQWYSNTYNDKKAPNKKKLIEFFKNKGCKVKGNLVYGVEFKDIELQGYGKGIDD
jgi:P4 family phage/plasmid primase-like protien